MRPMAAACAWGSPVAPMKSLVVCLVRFRGLGRYTSAGGVGQLAA
jgi:hypothetical protein